MGEAQANFNCVEELLNTHITRQPDKVALYCGDRTVTYGELGQDINRFANLLKGLGVKPKDRVLIVTPDAPEAVYAFLGSIKYGAWPIPTSNMLQVDEYEFRLEDSEVRLLVTTPDSTAASINTGPSCKKLYLDEGFDHRLKSMPDKAEPYLAYPNDTAWLLYSTGSTGRPKAAQRKQTCLVSTNEVARTQVDISEKDVMFTTSKLFYAYGITCTTALALRFGASAVLLPERPTGDLILENMLRFKPTLFTAVPTLYNTLLQKMGSLKIDFLRHCVTGGEQIPLEVAERWKEATGAYPIEGLGSTETLSYFTTNRIYDNRVGTVGTVVGEVNKVREITWPGFEVRILDEQYQEVPPGEPGTIYIRGGSLTPGYWNRPDANAEKWIPGGWFNTGDVGSQIDGYYTYISRTDDMMKVAGLWVSPLEVESVMHQHEAVHECGVVGHEVGGLVKPFAYVVLQEGWKKRPHKEIENSILDFLAKKLPRYKIPWGIYFIDQMPKTATNKVFRMKLREGGYRPVTVQ